MTQFISDRRDAVLWSIELWSDTKQAQWVQGTYPQGTSRVTHLVITKEGKLPNFPSQQSYYSKRATTAKGFFLFPAAAGVLQTV